MTACQAFSTALANKGMNSQQLAVAVGGDPARMSQSSATPTNEEYGKISQALGLGVPANHPR
ncbi:hypothetical protein M405DRAFT_862715 [Rhizopogon salebrosus TDB-379]|nr:hypothetical protein M405DRAFT_862715 [Rhizopogon salebrosus TDB-379]